MLCFSLLLLYRFRGSSTQGHARDTPPGRRRSPTPSRIQEETPPLKDYTPFRLRLFSSDGRHRGPLATRTTARGLHLISRLFANCVSLCASVTPRYGLYLRQCCGHCQLGTAQMQRSRQGSKLTSPRTTSTAPWRGIINIRRCDTLHLHLASVGLAQYFVVALQRLHLTFFCCLWHLFLTITLLRTHWLSDKYLAE